MESKGRTPLFTRVRGRVLDGPPMGKMSMLMVCGLNLRPSRSPSSGWKDSRAGWLQQPATLTLVFPFLSRRHVLCRKRTCYQYLPCAILPSLNFLCFRVTCLPAVPPIRPRPPAPAPCCRPPKTLPSCPTTVPLPVDRQAKLGLRHGRLWNRLPLFDRLRPGHEPAL